MTKPTVFSRLRTVAPRIAALLFGLIFAFALLEVAGRMVLGFDPLPGWAQDFNNRVGYELRPGETYTYASQSGEFETEVQHNQRGLHDVDHALTKPANTFRILVLSDSYGHAREVSLEQNFARQLEALLNATGPDNTQFEVINAGHFGLGTTQEYLYYTVEGQRYDPDLVLLGFYVGNDVVDNHAPLIKAWNNIATVDFPYFDVDGTLHQPGMSTRRRVLSWLRQNVYTANTVANALGNSANVEHVEVGDPNTVTAQTLRTPMGVYLPPDDTWAAAWSITAHALEQLDAAVRAHDAQLAVFVIPDRRQLYRNEWDATLAKLPDLDHTALDRDLPTRTILDLLAARNIPAVSLLKPFLIADERLYFPIDGHFTPAGHTLTAQTLANWLGRTHLIVDRDTTP